MSLRLSVVLGGFMIVSGCDCLGGVGVPFDETFTVELETEIGGSGNCALQGDETLDDDGNAVTTGDFGEVHYSYEHDGAVDPPPSDPNDPNAPTRCNVHVLRWSGALADMEEVITEIRDGVAEQGLDPDKATVNITSVEISNVAITVEAAGGDAFPLDNVGAYRAQMNITDGTASVDAAITVDNPGTGPVLPEHVSTTEDTAGLAALLNGAVNAGAELGGTGDADIQFRYQDLGTLTNDGEEAPLLHLSADLQVKGELNVGL